MNEGRLTTLAAVDALLANPERPFAELWVEMVEYLHANRQRHPMIGQYGRDMINTPAWEAGSKVSTTKRYLSFYRDPLIAQNMSRSGFRIADLMHAEEPVKETGYGPEDSITSNSRIQNAYPPNRVETAKYLSKMTGQATIVKTAVTMSGQRTGWLGQASKSLQEVQRPLLTVDEALRMPGPQKDAQGLITTPGDMVVFAAGRPAVYGRQPLYYQAPVFQARAELPPTGVTDTLVADPLWESQPGSDAVFGARGEQR